MYVICHQLRQGKLNSAFSDILEVILEVIFLMYVHM